MTVLRLQRHVNDQGKNRLEICSRNIDNVVWATEWGDPGDEIQHAMDCRMKVVEMLADLHNLLSNELRIA